MRESILTMIVVTGCTLLMSACGNAPPPASTPGLASSGGTTGSPMTTVSGQTPTAVVAETDSLKFSPPTVTVKVGDVVEWRNTGTTPHNVTFDAGPHSGTMNGGDTYEARFTAPGTFHYHCTFHAPGMAGVVVVTG